VRIVSGNTPLGPSANDGAVVSGVTVDVAVLDDFIFAEPRAIISEPGSIALVLLGLALVPLTFRRATARIDT